MSIQTAVEVFLGNPITVASEKQFLARQRRDVLTLACQQGSSPTTKVGT